jgi:hypothetical protein
MATRLEQWLTSPQVQTATSLPKISDQLQRKSQFKLDFVVSLDQWQNLSEVTREALVRP